MNLDTFFEKFDLFADAPNAVAKMRELILWLAVRGKLVRFEAKSGLQTVGDHVSFLNGYAFKSEWFKPHGIRLCRNANIGHGALDWRDVAFVDQSIADEFRRFNLNDGDIVLSLDRPIITTGLKVAKVTKADLPCLLLQRVAKPVALHDLLDMQYFLLWLKSPDFVNSIDPGRSNGVPHISTRQVLDLPFVLPPLAEQKRIVAKVDELMALCDRLEAQQQQREIRHTALAQASLTRFADAPTPANLPFLFHPSYAISPADLRKSILTLAVQGKLVPQDPNDEPAEDLLHSFRKEQVSCWPKKYEEPQGFSGIHLPYLPSGWHWYRAEQICGYITKGTTPDKTKMHSGHGEVPFLKVYNLTFNGELDFSIQPTFISRDTHESELARSSVRPNDVLMNIVGPPLGKVSVVTELYPEWNINQAIAVFHPLSGVIGRYLCLCLLQVLELSALVGAETRGSAGQDNISLAQCRGLPIPLPPLAEQKRIVAKVEQLMGLVDRLEAQLAESRAKATALLDAVVAELSAAA